MNKYLLIDTREKPKAIKSIIKTFDAAGIEYESTKLLFGDYMDFGRPHIVVDRKQNIAELAKNCTIEAERFKREIKRAEKANSTLVILVEQNRYKDRDRWIHVETIEDLMLWSATHKTKTGRDVSIRGEQIYRTLSYWCAVYPFRVEFCDKRNTGKRILEIIYGENDER